MTTSEEQQLFKIGAVARLTGVSVHTLRKWEQRHAVVKPHRSHGGKRLYTEGDVQRLALVKKLVDLGLSLQSIAGCSLDELADRWARLAGAELPAAQTGPVRVAVLGAGLGVWLRPQQGEPGGIEIAAIADDIRDLTRELGDSRIDLLLVECPAITGHSAREVRDFVQALDAPSALVVYWFGSRENIEALESSRIKVLRAPADGQVLQQAVIRSAAGRSADVPAAKRGPGTPKTPPEPRFSRESLASLALANPAASCGCQKNLVDVVLSLRALEDYLHGCDSRSPQDHALHRALWMKVGEARCSIEDAIEHFAAVEGIDL